MRAWTTIAALLGAAAISACSGGDAFLSSEGLGSLVIATIAGARVDLVGYAITDGVAIKSEVESGTTEYALGYAATLDELGLPAGPIAIEAEGLPLPRADRREMLVGRQWQEIATLPPALDGIRLAIAGACTSYTQDSRSLPRTEDIPLFGVALDDHRVLVASDAGRFQIHEATRSYEVTNMSTSTPHLAGLVYRGEVWLLGPGTLVAHGHPDRGFERGPPLPFDLQFGAAIDGASDDAPFEIFAIDARQGVAHFDGTTWRVIRPSTMNSPEGTRPGIAWIEPGLAFVIGSDIQGGSEISADGSERPIHFDVPPQANGDTLWRVVRVAGRGAVVGTRNNVVFSRRGGEWHQLPARNDIKSRTDVIIDLGGGAFYSGGQGLFVQWRGSDELCDEPLAVPGGVDVRLATRLGAGFVMMIDGTGARSVVFATRR